MSHEFGPLYYRLYPLHPTVTELKKPLALKAIPKAVEKTVEQLEILSGIGELGKDDAKMLEAAKDWDGNLNPKKGHSSYIIEGFPFCSGELDIYAFGIDGYPSVRILPTSWNVFLTNKDFDLVSDAIIKEFELTHQDSGAGKLPHHIFADSGKLGWYQRGADFASTLFLKRFTESYAIAVIENLGKYEALKNDLSSFSKLMDITIH